MCNIPVLPVAASILDKYKDVAVTYQYHFGDR